MTVDPPSVDRTFDEPAAPAELGVTAADLDREWVIGEAAAVFGLTTKEAEKWVNEDGVVAVYARIQEHWDAL
ncbi:hypothetical protein JCM17823_10440 [Halorubrum gandharaense]